LTEIQATIKLRIDVDYPYPSSRKKSFFYVALGIKNRRGKDYLRNARVIAKMINESPKKVKAYWFFTQYTIPDKKLLDLLTPDRHEIGLHIANDAEKELKSLEKETGRTITFYTYHGTSNRFAQILWKRKLGQKQSSVPNNFRLQSFHEYTTTSLDTRIYQVGLDTVKEETKTWLKEGTVISIHPEWLFVTGEKNHRGRYYEALKYLLEVDHEFESVQVRKKFFVKIAKDNQEYEKNASPTKAFIEKLEDRRADIYTFLERSWCCPITNPQSNWLRTEDNVGLLEITNFDDWFSSVGKKTRNMVRRAEKSGVKVKVVELNDKLVEGIWKIYNETPIRQGRAFPHYGESLKSVGDNMAMAKKATFIGAYLEDELVGFIQIVYGDQIAIISQILSLQKHWDKALNNALLAKAVEVCANNGNRWLMYGRIGNHPSLDTFKENNGFKKVPIARYYVALTLKGKFAMRLGLHRDLKDALPQWLKSPLIPVFSWISRNKAKVKRRLRSRQ
jgi:hypothetical protein